MPLIYSQNNDSAVIILEDFSALFEKLVYDNLFISLEYKYAHWSSVNYVVEFLIQPT